MLTPPLHPIDSLPYIHDELGLSSRCQSFAACQSHIGLDGTQSVAILSGLTHPLECCGNYCDQQCHDGKNHQQLHQGKTALILRHEVQTLTQAYITKQAPASMVIADISVLTIAARSIVSS